MNAKANFIISAQDETRDAIRSIQANFRSLDQGIKSTARGINSAMSVLAGFGLTSLFRGSLEVTAAAAGANSEFARTLEDVKQSARDLMVPKDGLPGVTQSLQELAATLKDPAIVSAADALFSTLTQYATDYLNLVAKGAAGWRIMLTGSGGNDAVDIDSKIRRLEGRADFFAADQSDTGRRKYRELIREAQQLRIEYWRAVQGPAGEGLQKIDASSAMQQVSDFIDGQSAKFDAQGAAVKEYTETVKELQKALEKMPGETASVASDQLQEILAAQEASSKARADFFAETQEQGKEQARRGAEEAKKMLEDMTEYAKEAARSMQDALAQFLFDPLHDGFKGLLKDAIDTFRRIAVEAAAAHIFDSKSKGGMGIGDIIIGGVKAFFGGFKAEGGPLTPGKWHIAGEKGPEPIWGGGPGAFALGYPKGGGSVTINNNVDARGADPSLIGRLPQILQENNRRLEATIVSRLKRGIY